MMSNERQIIQLIKQLDTKITNLQVMYLSNSQCFQSLNEKHEETSLYANSY